MTRSGKLGLLYAQGITRADFHRDWSARKEVASILFGSKVPDVRPAGTIERAEFYKAEIDGEGIRGLVLKRNTGKPVSEAIAIGAARLLGANSYGAVILDDGLVVEQVPGGPAYYLRSSIVNWAKEIGEQVPYAILVNSLDASRTNVIASEKGPRKATLIDYGFGLRRSDDFWNAEREYFGGQGDVRSYRTPFWNGVLEGKGKASLACTPELIRGVSEEILGNSERMRLEGSIGADELAEELASHMGTTSRAWSIEAGIGRVASYFLPSKWK